MSELPKVELLVNGSGRGYIKIDGIELHDVTSVTVNVKAGRLTTVAVSFPADVKFSADETAVLVNRDWSNFEGGRRTNGSSPAEKPDVPEVVEEKNGA